MFCIRTYTQVCHTEINTNLERRYLHAINFINCILNIFMLYVLYMIAHYTRYCNLLWNVRFNFIWGNATYS